MPTTLKDVAEKVGVSVATVSRVLNDQPGISAATRARVLQVARELNYSANMSARGLATARTFNIGLIAYRRSSHLNSDIVPVCDIGIQDALDEQNYHMLPVRVDQDIMRSSAQHLPIVQGGRVDGLLVIGPELERRYIIQLYNTGLPIVLIDNMLDETHIDCVLSDNEYGTYKVTQHLIDAHHHRQTVFLSGPTGWLSSRERYAGYTRALTEAGLEPHRVVMPDTTIETGQDAMRQAFEEVPDLTAVVGVNDATAWGAGRACKEAGLVVPDDVAIVGYDDVGWARLHEPPLTTVRAHFHEIGYQAARRLIELIEQDASTPLRIRIATEIILRGSCGTHQPDR